MIETEKTEKYAFFYKRLLHSTHIVRQDTGEEIEIPPETETLYSYMRDQYESYKVRKKPFFESQESMGLKFKGRDRRWIAARIEVLNRLGLVKSEEQERDSYGHKRFHHTVISLEEVSDNLLFYGPASISGGILAEGMLIRPLKKKKPRGTPKKKKAAGPTGDALHHGSATGTTAPKNEEKKGNGEQAQQQEHEQQSPGVSPTAIYSESKPVQRADGVASSSATDDPEQQSGVSQFAGDSCDDVSANDDPSLSKPDGGNVVGIPWLNAPFEGFQLRPEARRWAQSQGATTWQDEIKLVWKLKEKTNMGEPGEHMRPDDIPAPEPAKQQANGYAPQLDYDDSIPF